MSQTKEEPLILINVMEEVVRDEMRMVIKEMNACSCDRCYFDACAMVLNNMKPKYATTTKGSLLSRIPLMLMENRTNLYFDCAQAVKAVMNSPRH